MKYFITFLILVIGVQANAKKLDRKVASTFIKQDCSVTVYFNHGAGTGPEILKKKGFKGDFVNGDIDTAPALSQFIMYTTIVNDDVFKDKPNLSELVIADSNGQEIWHSGLKVCNSTGDRFQVDNSCQEIVIKLAPKCAGGKLVL